LLEAKELADELQCAGFDARLQLDSDLGEAFYIFIMIYKNYEALRELGEDPVAALQGSKLLAV